MSGPWDRRPPEGPDDEWPSADRTGAPHEPASDPWSTDPWSDPPAQGSSWGVWPPADPAPEDVLPDDAELPVSDPWAESWTDEAAASPRSDSAPEQPTEPRAWTSYPSPPAQPWMPADDPWGSDAPPVVDEPVVDRVTFRPSESAAVDADPWDVAQVAADTADEPAPAHDEAPLSDAIEALRERATTEPSGPVGTPPAPEQEFLPHDEPEPEFVAPPPPVTPAARTSWIDRFRHAAPVAVPEAQPELEWEEPEREPEPRREPEPEAGAAKEPRDAERDRTDDGDREAEIAGLAAAVRHPVPGALQSAVALEPEPVTPPEREPEWEPEPEPPPGPDPEVDLWVEPQPDPQFDEHMPWVEPVAAEPPAPPEPAWTPQPWRDRAEATQVLPTSWAPREPAVEDQTDNLDPVVGRIRVSLAQQQDAEAEGEPDVEPSTAEQAVPWLIGVILLLAGMVIVLLALIFAGDASLRTAAVVPSSSGMAAIASPTPSPTPDPTASVTPTERPSASASPPPAATPTPVPVAQYGALEMVYQGRSAALAPIYLLHRDFTKAQDSQEILAHDPNLDVRRFAWSPDGTVGAGLLADVLVSIEPGKAKRRLAEGISAITFGSDSSTVYAVRTTQNGGNDVGELLAVDFATGEARAVATQSYPRPAGPNVDALADAQFTDEGGNERLYWVDGTLRYWVYGAGTWEIDPEDGTITELEEDARPTLWSPDGDRRITAEFDAGTSTIALLDDADEQLLTATVEGRVSHMRWSPNGERVVFTVGRAGAGGGVQQNLYLWDLNENEPMQLTATGAAFGAEWLGAQPAWKD